jgi:membrane-bound metal-dependent hydrolase YbcI (DUF457 family)
MMGKPHALSGAAAWLVIAPVAADVTGLFDMPLQIWLAGAVVSAGAALAPDLDHGTNSFARGSLGPVTRGISNVVAIGGHRKITHSWLGVVLATALLGVGIAAPRLFNTGWAGPLGAVAPLIVVFMLLAFALAAAGLPPYRVRPPMRFIMRAGFAAAATAGIAAFVQGDWGWLMFALPLGLIVHCIGDAITIAGVPWLWPLGRSYRLARMQAGGPTERYIITPIFIIVILVSLAFGIKDGNVFGYPTDTEQANSQPR